MNDIYHKCMSVIGFQGANGSLETPVPANITPSSKGLYFTNTDTNPASVTIQFYGATAGSTVNLTVYVPGSGSKSSLLDGAGSLLLPIRAKQIVIWGGLVTASNVNAFEIY